MVTNTEELDRIFGALADPIRRSILARLARGEATVGELAEPYAISRPAVSKHLRVLERAGLVDRTPDGRTSRCELDPAPIRNAAEWLQRYRSFWESRLDELERYVEDEATTGNEEEEELRQRLVRAEREALRALEAALAEG